MWRSREYSMCCGRTWLWSISSATARRSMSKVFNVEQKPLQDCKTIFFRVLLGWSVWIDPIESHQNHFVHYTNFDPKVFKQIQIEACDLVQNLLEGCAKHQAARSGALRTPSKLSKLNSKLFGEILPRLWVCKYYACLFANPCSLCTRCISIQACDGKIFWTNATIN